MNRLSAILLILITLYSAQSSLAIVVIFSGGEKTYPIGGESGVQLDITSSGKTTALHSGGTNFILGPVSAGLHLCVYDGVGGAALYPVRGTVRQGQDGVVQQEAQVGGEFTIHAQYRFDGNSVQISGEVLSSSTGDRAVDLVFRLPLAALSEWAWCGDTRDEFPATNGSFKSATYPLASVVNHSANKALGLALSPDIHVEGVLGCSQEEGFFLRIAYGLSPAVGGALRNRAPFSFSLFAPAPEETFRSALEWMYSRHSQLFARRTEHAGLWLFLTQSAAVPNPYDYAFHEAAGDMAGWEDDRGYGILTFPYGMAGQREITKLAALPSGYDEVLQALEDYVPTTQVRYKELLGWGLDIKSVLYSCSLYDAAGQYTYIVRNTVSGGNSVTFTVNPSPWLPSNELTVASCVFRTMDVWTNELGTGFAGLYVDSLSQWGQQYNFRRDHFMYTRTPLTYDPVTKKVCILNEFSHRELLEEAGRRLHSSGRLLFVNGMRENEFQSSYAVDLPGVETSVAALTNDNFRVARHFRAMAAQKPALLLNNNTNELEDRNVMERYWKTSAAFGFFPAYNSKYQTRADIYDRDREFFENFLPQIRACHLAGWEPVTGVSCDDPSVVIERFGSRSREPLYFTIYNPSESGKELSWCAGVPGYGYRTVLASDPGDLYTLKFIRDSAPVFIDTFSNQVPADSDHLSGVWTVGAGITEAGGFLNITNTQVSGSQGRYIISKPTVSGGIFNFSADTNKLLLFSADYQMNTGNADSTQAFRLFLSDGSTTANSTNYVLLQLFADGRVNFSRKCHGTVQNDLVNEALPGNTDGYNLALGPSSFSLEVFSSGTTNSWSGPLGFISGWETRCQIGLTTTVATPAGSTMSVALKRFEVSGVDVIRWKSGL